LPFAGQEGRWIALHLLVAVAGMLVALFLDRRRAAVG